MPLTNSNLARSIGLMRLPAANAEALYQALQETRLQEDASQGLISLAWPLRGAILQLAGVPS